VSQYLHCGLGMWLERVAGDVRFALKSANVVTGTVRGTMLMEKSESLPQELKTHERKDKIRWNVD